MRSRFFVLVQAFLVLLVVLCLSAPIALAVQRNTSLSEGVVKTVLDNGLTVLTKEVRTAPVATVQVWYRVGSRNERPGITGISHKVEHLLFKGTKSRPIQFGRLFSALGSNSNAFTSYDMTAYYGTVGSGKIEALLELEADRMANTRAGKEEVESERTVVLSELDGGNNNPATRLYTALTRKALAGTNYQWPVIGERKDVENFTVEQIQDYYRQFYRPDNAILIVVGDFDTKTLLEQVKKYFGNIPRPTTPIPQPPKVEPLPFINDSPIVLRESGSVPFLQAIYTGLPPAGHPDNPALDIMDSVLSSGRSSRFYQALVETGIASSVSGYTSNLIDTGWYFLSATPVQGKSLDEVERTICREIEKLKREGITTQELERAKNQIRASVILSNRSINSQAQQLGYYQTVMGDYRYIDRYLRELEQVSPSQVRQVAQKYLKIENRSIAYFQPTTPAAGGTASPTVTPTQHDRGLTTPLDPTELQKYLPKSALKAQPPALNPVRPETITLPNGLRAILLQDRSTPTFSLSGFIEAGSVWDTPDKAGLASVVAQNLLSGTKTKTALELATNLENRGATLNFSASREGVYISGSGLANDLSAVLTQLAEVLREPSFPERELRLSLARNVTGLQQELETPASLARRIFQSTLYPEGHPFHAMRTFRSLESIKRDDLEAFFRRHYQPSGMILVLTGDFEPAQVRQLLTETFNWGNDSPPLQLNYPPTPPPQGIVRKSESLRGKSQTITIMGHLGITRNDPRYDAAQVLNQILGGDTLASRLGVELRDRQGLTYGVYSFFGVGRKSGTFQIQMQTNPQDTERAINLALGILRDIREKGVTPAELEQAKTSIINNFPADFTSPDAIASAILSDAIYGLPSGNFYTFPARIQAITLDQVNRTAKELLFPDNLLIVSVGPSL